MEAYLKNYKNKTIVITGGAGCIGSNLTRALLDADVKKVIVVDDLSSAERWNVPSDSKVAFILGSILNDEILKQAFFDKPDYVFHLAAHFANQNSVDHPETDLMVNGLGILKVLQYSYLSKVEKFFFASSGCSVYGSQAPLPLKEDFISLHLDTPYQITKLLGEVYCNFFHEYYRLPLVIGRYFNVYGPGEVPGKYRNVIPNFIYWAISHQPLLITGTGEETRDFTYVDDIVDGTLRCAAIPQAIGQAINLASEKETRVIDIAQTIKKLAGDVDIKFVERRSWDKITKRRASIEKAGKLLAYHPEVEISEGIKRTFNWIVENRDNIEKSIKNTAARY